MTAFNFVGITTSPTALATALHVPELRNAALGNKHLPADLWIANYRPKPALKVDVAKAMVSYPLEPRVLDHLIAVEKRCSVLEAAFKVSRPTAEQLRALLSAPGFSRSVAIAVVDRFLDLVDLDWLRAAASAAGSVRLEYWLAAPAEVTDEQVAADLLDYPSWGEEWDSARLQRLLATRPGVLPAAVRSTSLKVRTAAAGCRFLTDPVLQREVSGLDDPACAGPDGPSRGWREERAFLWMALVYNPAVSLEVVRDLDPVMRKLEDYKSSFGASNRLTQNPRALTGLVQEVSDPSLIAWLLKRTLPSDFDKEKGKQGRFWDLSAMLDNPNLSEGDVELVIRRLRGTPLWDRHRSQVRALLERYPVLAREAGLSLDETDDGEESFPAGEAVQPQLEHRPNPALDMKMANVGFSGHFFELASAHFDAAVGDSPESWLFLFRTLDAGSFTGTVADLADVACFTGVAGVA